MATENVVKVIQEIADFKKYFMKFLNQWILIDLKFLIHSPYVDQQNICQS